MIALTKLSEEQVKVFLNMIPTWKFEKDVLVKVFQLQDFKAALALVDKVAQLAEEANHHPNILIEYNKVSLMLTTHEIGGITGRDFALAQRIDSLPVESLSR
jgi:4a-hydroxytetrahydrobiopterin dehydratase